jgi:NADPH-dependent 2,4-dienoyl-CoA reductase/sulfur reductase-like enzyme
VRDEPEGKVNIPEPIIMETDVLVVGGGTAGPMAAVKAKEKNPKLRVMLLEKANVKRSGAISMGLRDEQLSNDRGTRPLGGEVREGRDR